MSTDIRPEVSRKNRYWIERHRYYELKHFCLQYRTWKKNYAVLCNVSLPSAQLEKMPMTNAVTDPTAKCAIEKATYFERISLIERVAMETDKYLYWYILKAVTEGLSYTYLKTKLGLPCGKDLYYDRYRRFFWLLSKTRD